MVSGNLFQNYFRPPLDPISIPTTLPNKATENKRKRKGKTTTDIINDRRNSGCTLVVELSGRIIAN